MSRAPSVSTVHASVRPSSSSAMAEITLPVSFWLIAKMSNQTYVSSWSPGVFTDLPMEASTKREPRCRLGIHLRKRSREERSGKQGEFWKGFPGRHREREGVERFPTGLSLLQKRKVAPYDQKYRVQ